MDRKKIAVLFGGCSTEYDVSIASAHSVISNMDDKLFDAIPIGISREGNWFRYYGKIENIANDEWHRNKEDCVQTMLSPDRDVHGIIEIKDGEVKITSIDAAFPVLHGKNGEDGSVQGLLELTGIPIIGCGIISSALCMDKVRAKKLVEYAGVKSSVWCEITRMDTAGRIFEKMRKLTYPVFVKPIKSGSSIGITKVYAEKDLIDAIEEAFEHDDEVIVEENVKGFEVGCAVIGNDELIAGEVDEIELDVDWFDYHEKYTQKHSKIHMPARIDDELLREIKEISKNIYKELGCRGFARIDMFLTKNGELLFNEVNTIPGLTSHSRFPKMMKGAGYEFPELVNKLISMGVEKSWN